MKRKSRLIAGLDEVGMGCLAGPLVVCVVAFREDEVRIAGVRDSKKVQPNARKRLMPEIIERAEFVGLGFATVETINRRGLSSAWQTAANMALRNAPVFDLLVVDGERSVKLYNGKQLVKPKADVIHWEVSAASIVAKVMRDLHMEDLAGYYPNYDWESNSGYGTQSHRDALLESGPTPHHRTKFIRKILAI